MMEVWSYFLEFHGERFKLEGRNLTVGRSHSCDVTVKDPSVSRRHVQVTPRSGKIQLTDLGSSNGCFVNGERVVGAAELADGDVLGLGDADLHVRITPKAAFETVRMPKAAMPELPPDVTGTAEGSFSDVAWEVSDVDGVRGASDVRDSIPEIGEATGILQAESMRLAKDALRDTLEDSAVPVGGRIPAADPPGSHMAPPPVAGFAAPPSAPELEPPPAATDFGDAPAWTTQVLPTVLPPPPTIELPDLPEPELPAVAPEPPAHRPAPPAAAPQPAPPAPAPSAPRIERPAALGQSPRPARPLPIPEPPAPPAPMEDVREAGLPPVPSRDEAGDGLRTGEILPSLEGFDTTLGPGVALPESMRRARENLAQRRAAEDEQAVLDAYRQPAMQAPPMAGFWIRALATLLDGLWFVGLGVVGWLSLGELGSLVASAVSTIVILGGWAIWGTTPGKRVLGLYVYTADGQAGLGLGRSVLRFAAYFLSLLPLGAGFLVVLSPARRGLHDRIAGTYVRHYG